MRTYASEMRGRWKLLWLALAAGAAIGWWVWRNSPGGDLTLWTGLVGWGTVIAVTIVAYRVMKCPACGQRLGSLQDKVCRSCGAILTEEPPKPRSEKGPSPEVASYMRRSEEILANWSKFRSNAMLRWSPVIVGLLTWIVCMIAFGFGSVNKNFGEGAVIGFIVGLCMTMIWWLLMVQVLDVGFDVVFSIWRGRCPICRKWFTTPTTVTPGAIITHVSLPDFCPSCGERLR